MSDTPDNIWTVLSTCSVCGKALDKDSSPHLLPCCHSSCKECILDNTNQLIDIINTNSTEKLEFKCKTCSQDYSPEECIENYFQETYWSRKKSDGTQVCQSCEGQNKTAVIKCKTCDWICSECQTLHNTIKVFKGHELDETTKITAKDSTTLCPLHNEELTVYCKTCRNPYCCRCILKDHNLHVYEDTKDSNQLNNFYNNFNIKVDAIKEKRSFAENILQKFETIETDISGQKEVCIARIKTIVSKLQEKVSELGTSLLDKVNTICHQKELEYKQKKTQLRQMNSSFKYTEHFMSTILGLDDPMGVMKAQDLLTAQLQKLLNKPCSHPDFITPFKIEVIDALSDGQQDGQQFDVGKMIDGVFNMCFKIKTTDDRKEELNNSSAVHTNQGNGVDDEISIIGVTKSSTPPTRPQTQLIQSVNQHRGLPKASTFRAVVLPPGQGVRTSLPTIIRGNGNRELSGQHLGGHSYNTLQNNSYANQMQYPTPAPATATATNTLHDRSLSALSHRLQSNGPYCHAQSQGHSQAHSPPALRNSAPIQPQSMPQMQSNFMPQTGILTGSYGTPQVFKGAVCNQTVQQHQSAVSAVVSSPNTQYSYTNPPNITINQNQQLMHTYGITQNGQQFVVSHSQPLNYGNTSQTTTQSMGTTQPTVVRPNLQPQPNSQIINQLTQTTNNILNNQSGQTSQTSLAQQQLDMQRKRLEKQSQERQAQERREIQRIANDLRESSSNFPSTTLPPTPSAQRAYNIPNAANSQSSVPKQNTANVINSSAPSTNRSAPTTVPITVPTTVQSLPSSDITYELHIPDDTSITPIVSTAERRSSGDSFSQRRESRASNPSPPVTSQSLVQNSSSSVPTTSAPTPSVQTPVHSSNERTAFSMPTLSDVFDSNENPSEAERQPIPNQNRSTDQTTTRETEMPERPNIMPFHLSNPPSVGSLFSELSNEDFPEIIESNSSDNTREESRENTTSVTTSTAPVARIAPMTNETENPNNESQEIVDNRGDDLTEDEAIDEDADCVVCSKEYGEFICCSQCPRAFHCECHVPELKKMPETSFICTFCKSLDQMAVDPRRRKPGLNDRQQRNCEKVLIHLLCHKKSQDFKPPVSDTIKQKLNLYTIKKKLENKEFENEIQFIDDIKRLFSRFKNRDITPEVMEEYKTFERYFKKVIHKLMPSFSEALQNNTSIDSSDSVSGSAPKKTKSNCVSV